MAACFPPHAALATTQRLPHCVCTARSPKGSEIKVVVSGAGSNLGKSAIQAITKARGMALAGAVDSVFVGRDAGEIAGTEESLEIPILNDLVMVLASLSQSSVNGVMVDFSPDPARVYENVRQATAFGMRSVVCGVPAMEAEILDAMSTFCDKASTGCVVCPSLSIGRVLLQQAAIAAAFHYASVHIVEASEEQSSQVPSSEAIAMAGSLSGLGRIYNQGERFPENPARGALVGDEGVRVHSLSMPGGGDGASSLEVRLSAPGEMLLLKHDILGVDAMMPGLLLAIRRVVRLKSLVYGLEKIL